VNDEFERRLRDHLHREAEQTRDFPRPLRSRIREAIAPRTRARLVPQLALAGALVLVAVAVLAVRNWPSITGPAPSTRSSAQPTPSMQPFTCSDRSGGANGLSAQLTGIRIASHEADGYDRIVFDFSGGIPSYTLSRLDSSTFVRDASGQQVNLDGSAGIRIVFHDTDLAPGISSDVKPALRSVREVEQIGNYERVVSYGVGVSTSQCIRVMELSSPSRLVVDIQTTG
jgi:hypothetical protein